MSEVGKIHSNNPSNNGIVAAAGDSTWRSVHPHHVVIRAYILMVPQGGYRTGESNTVVHWSNGYSPALRSAFDRRILKPDGSSNQAVSVLHMR